MCYVKRKDMFEVIIIKNPIKIGDEIVNCHVDIVLDNIVILENMCGIIADIYDNGKQVTVKWKMVSDDEKYITNVYMEKLIRLLEMGVLKNTKDFMEVPEPKFELGDIVSSGNISGIIIDHYYSYMKKKWFYVIQDIRNLLSGNTKNTIIEDNTYLIKKNSIDTEFSRCGYKNQYKVHIEKIH